MLAVTMDSLKCGSDAMFMVRVTLAAGNLLSGTALGAAYVSGSLFLMFMGPVAWDTAVFSMQAAWAVVVTI